MRLFPGILLVGILMGAAPGQITLGFEGSAVGMSVSGTPDPEGWSSTGGTVTIAPFGPVASPTSQFPTQGGQWAILHSLGAAGALNGPVGGPAPYPIAPGASANVSVPVQVPFATPGQQLTLSIDYLFVSPECMQSSTYNDWCSVDLVDPATGLSVLNVVFRDTWSSTLSPTGVTPNETGTVTVGACAGALEEAPVGTAHTVTVAVPPALEGQNLRFEAHVADGGDGSFNSWMYLDQVRFQGGIPAPGPMTSTVTDLPGGQHLYTVDAPAVPIFGISYELYTLVSETPAAPTGSGAFLGLHFDNLTTQIITMPLGTHPFHVTMATTPYVWGPFDLPPGTVIDWVTVAIRSTPFPLIAEVTGAQTKTF